MTTIADNTVPIYTTIGGLSSKFDKFLAVIAIRQRSWRQFFCAYIWPIRDLWVTAFCVLLSFVFYEEKKMWHFATDAIFTLRNR